MVWLSLVTGTKQVGGDEDYSIISGYASAYAEGVFRDVVRYRLANDMWRVQPPYDWYYMTQGYVATNDCSQVGMTAELIDEKANTYNVLIADCGGADGGSRWMSLNGIIVEMDWKLWSRLTQEHGRPLIVSLKVLKTR